jgi:hypothetical protein
MCPCYATPQVLKSKARQPAQAGADCFGNEVNTCHDSAAAAGSIGGQIVTLCTAPAGSKIGNIDMTGQGVRVTATGPAAWPPRIAHVLWVEGYDAALEATNPRRSGHVFLLCDDERFQPRQPHHALSLCQLCDLVGYSGKHSICTRDLRLAQSWQSAPGGPMHAAGMPMRDVSACVCGTCKPKNHYNIPWCADQ